jgi:hypothetical protein
MAVPPNSSDSIDTGIGGFEIPPEIDPAGRGGIYTYDVGDPDREPDPNYPERNTQLHGGNVSVDHSKKDLSKTTKLTLGHYLGKKTSNNYYRVDTPRDESQQKETKITRSIDGTTPQLKDSDNREGFAWREDIKGAVDEWTNPIGPIGWSGGRNQNDPFFQPSLEHIPLSKGFDKPLDGTSYTGHDLLSTVQENPMPVLRYSLTSLSNNRFTPQNNFFVMNNDNPERPGEKFDRVNNFNVPYTHPRYGLITTDQMSQIGGIVTRNASQVAERIFTSETSNSSFGLEINNREMIDKALVDISQIIPEISPDNSVLYSSIDNGEWNNVMNSPDWQFTNGGLTDQSWMTVLNAGAIAAIAIYASGLDLLNKGLNQLSSFAIGGLSELTTATTNKLGFSRLEGEQKENVENTISDVLEFGLDTAKGLSESFIGPIPGSGLIPTQGPYWKCMALGLLSFFTEQSDLGNARSIVKAFAGATNMGHVRPVMRLINRSFNFFIQKDIESWWGALGAVISGKTLDILNIFATIGDKILDREFYKDKIIGIQERLGSQQTDAFLSDFSALHLTRNNMGHSSTNARTLLLNVQGVTVRSPLRGSEYGDDDTIFTNKTPPSNSGGLYIENSNEGNQREDSGFDKNRITRIPTEISSQFEASLQSEYIPFYFHDIRTNEIISFHAFLENLQDTFTSAIDPVEAMGRVEPIKIYKGTQRKVGFSFYIVALSQADFSVMWEKINKLITLVYPQYTRGRILEHVGKQGDFNDPSFKFIQPFSQMMSASPMIRLRIGNVIRSNYTDEAMEDLFGVTEDDMFNPEANFPEFKIPPVQTLNDQYVYFDTDRTETLGKNNDRLQDNDETLRQIARYILNNFPYIEKIQLIGRADERNSDKYNFDLADRRIKSTIESIMRHIRIALEGARNDSEKTSWLQNQGISSVGIKGKFESINQGESNSTQGAKKDPKNEWKKDRVVIVKMITKQRQVSKEVEQKIAKLKSEIASATLSKGDLIQNFMNFGQNSIIRTFKDSGAGGGLAGFLESMSFEWISGNQTTWDVNEGRKAPKICKVTMDFSPIHDITPGLGWKGNNRAPVYNFSNFKAMSTPPPLLEVPKTSERVAAATKDLEDTVKKEIPQGPFADSDLETAQKQIIAEDAAVAAEKAKARAAAAKRAAAVAAENEKREKAKQTVQQIYDSIDGAISGLQQGYASLVESAQKQQEQLNKAKEAEEDYRRTLVPDRSRNDRIKYEIAIRKRGLHDRF